MAGYTQYLRTGSQVDKVLIRNILGELNDCTHIISQRQFVTNSYENKESRKFSHFKLMS